jgi:short-subunit dehydrogenase
MDIRRKTVVLTGATGGIGRAIAERLNAEGARLVLVARNLQRLTEFVDTLVADGHRVVPADIGDDSGRRRVVEACRDAEVSLLINAAGVGDFGLFEDQTADSIRRLVGVNLLGPMLLTLDLLPLLEKRESCIINIGSTFGSIGYPGFSSYCASKFGLRGFTEALRRELGDGGTRVAYLAPRATRTELNTASVVAMNDALGTAMDEPSLVAGEVLGLIRRAAGADRYIGWPEKLFVRINALFPKLVDSSLRKQLPIIRRFAARQP